jgi:hypothetical protein
MARARRSSRGKHSRRRAQVPPPPPRAQWLHRNWRAIWRSAEGAAAIGLTAAAVTAGDLITAFVLLGIAASVGFVAVLTETNLSRYPKVIALACLLMFFSGVGEFVRWRHSADQHATPTADDIADQVADKLKPNVQSTVALIADCSIGYLPIHIAPGQSINFVQFNPTILTRTRFGLGQYTRSVEDRVDQLPRPDDMAILRSTRGRSPLSYGRCVIENHGSATVMHAGIPLDFGYSPGKSAINFPYTVVTGPIEPGGRFEFFIFNACNTLAMASVGNIAKVSVAGNSSIFETPLTSQGRNPIEAMMFLSPSRVNWLRTAPCESLSDPSTERSSVANKQ